MTDKEAFEKEQDKLRERFGTDPALRQKKITFLLEMRYSNYKPIEKENKETNKLPF